MPTTRTDAPPTALGRILAAEGRSQAWLARQVGTDRYRVHRWVWDGHRPDDATAEAVARTLRRTLSELGWGR